MTPADVHHGRVTRVIEIRAQALSAAYDANPARFKGKRPEPKLPPEAVWINPPLDGSTDEQAVA